MHLQPINTLSPEFISTLTRRMEELGTLKSNDCPECPGPPPKFRLPPPPRPSFLTEGTFCSEAPLTELEDCVTFSIIDASYHKTTSLQSTALIITCSVILLLMTAIASIAFWKHKRKVQNFFPCKNANRMSSPTLENARRQTFSENGVNARPQGAVILYDDFPDSMTCSQIQGHHYVNNTAQPTIEMLDVVHGVFMCSNSHSDTYSSQDLYDSVYQELNNDNHNEMDIERELNEKNRSYQLNHINHYDQLSNTHSVTKQELTEDETLSIGEASEVNVLTTGKSVWGSSTMDDRVFKERRSGKSPRSLGRHHKNKNHDVGEFHEGKLLDALLRLYPSVAGITGIRANGSINQRQQPMSTVTHRLPYFLPPISIGQALGIDENSYKSVPVLKPLQRRSVQNRKYSQCRQDYHKLRCQEDTNIYAQLEGYIDVCSQSTDGLHYDNDKYARPVYYVPGEFNEIASEQLYQAQPDVFSSDSGYSNNTSSTIETCHTSDIQRNTTKIRHNKYKHRNHLQHLHHSSEYIIS